MNKVNYYNSSINLVNIDEFYLNNNIIAYNRNMMDSKSLIIRYY